MFKFKNKMISGIVLVMGTLLFTIPAVHAKKYDGVTVNILTMEAPQIKGPMVKRAPDFKKLTGATVNIIGVPFADIYPKMKEYTCGRFIQTKCCDYLFLCFHHNTHKIISTYT